MVYVAVEKMDEILQVKQEILEDVIFPASTYCKTDDFGSEETIIESETPNDQDAFAVMESCPTAEQQHQHNLCERNTCSDDMFYSEVTGNLCSEGDSDDTIVDGNCHLIPTEGNVRDTENCGKKETAQKCTFSASLFARNCETNCNEMPFTAHVKATIAENGNKTENHRTKAIYQTTATKARRKKQKSPDERFRCDLCCKNYSGRWNLEQHNARQHNGPGNLLHCPACEKGFSCQRSLNDHMNIHTGLKPYKCEVCEKSFAFQSNLQSHINTVHYKHKPFECSACGKTFAYKSILGKHMRIHTGAVPYECPYCSKKFGHSSHRNRHIRRIHKDMMLNSVTVLPEKRHECKVCGKCFTESNRLKVHIQSVHEKLKPHVCLYCKRKFATTSSRNTHVKKMHEDEE